MDLKTVAQAHKMSERILGIEHQLHLLEITPCKAFTQSAGDFIPTHEILLMDELDFVAAQKAGLSSFLKRQLANAMTELKALGIEPDAPKNFALEDAA